MLFGEGKDFTVDPLMPEEFRTVVLGPPFSPVLTALATFRNPAGSSRLSRSLLRELLRWQLWKDITMRIFHWL